jgi:two-component system alkaline phosphatase synthesis response regulator PhoP
MAVPSVLICDDDPLLRELLEFKLSLRGYAVRVAADGAEALAAIDDAPPDVLVLDAMMPNVDGYETLRRLRADPRRASLPVLMLTARRRADDVVSALELGANDYLVKPFMPEELLARIGRLAPKAPKTR